MSGETQSSAAGGPAAGWGVPDFLPPNVARRALRDDAREAIESKRAEAEREAQAEARHQRAMALYAEQAELRGELVTAMQLATGQVRGRSVQDILAAAVAAADRDDVVTAARMHRDGAGDPERVHVEVAEPVILAPPVKRSIASRSRRWQAWREKVAEAEAARKAVEDDRRAFAARNDWGLVDNVTRRSREDDDPLVVLSASRRRGGPAPGDNGVRELAREQCPEFRQGIGGLISRVLHGSHLRCAIKGPSGANPAGRARL